MARQSAVTMEALANYLGAFHLHRPPLKNMHTPRPFLITDHDVILSLIGRHSFATVVSQDAQGAPFASHLPVLHRVSESGGDVLITHMARANPQWRHWTAERELLTIFHGPHAYVSPGWYHSSPMVPTWNYAAVHVYGMPRLIEDDGDLHAMLRGLTDHFEAGQAQPYGTRLTDDHIHHLLPGLVGFEIFVTRMEATFKLSQNRSPEDRDGVIAALAASKDPMDREVALLMQQTPP
jgi:transcriptional regulator